MVIIYFAPVSLGAPAEGCLAPGWRQSNPTDELMYPWRWSARTQLYCNLSELDNPIINLLQEAGTLLIDEPALDLVIEKMKVHFIIRKIKNHFYKNKME